MFSKHQLREEEPMEFYTKSHKYTAGSDLHGRNMYLCVLNQSGERVLHRSIRNNPEYLEKVLEPYRKDLVLGAECIFNWYWLADFCRDRGIKFVLGHALYMKAIHGGKAKNDKIDSQQDSNTLKRWHVSCSVRLSARAPCG